MVDSFSRQPLFYDWIGLSAGLLCAVHCALTPLLFAAVPLLRGAGGWWGWLDVVFLLVSLVAVGGIVRSTGLGWVRWSTVTAWLVLAAGLAGERGGVPGCDYVMYLGAAGLFVVHLANLRSHRRHKHGSLSRNLVGGVAGAGQQARQDTHANCA